MKYRKTKGEKMRIWITRHGQTDLNKQSLWQGRIDQPLNETGRAQAREARDLLLEKISELTGAQNAEEFRFDAVYASPLDRACETASIVGNVDRDQIIVDDRIIEADFGKYDAKPYVGKCLPMNLYWTLPEVFPAPKTVESIDSMVSRSSEFLKELEEKGYENVLIVCHGGIIRALCGYLEDRKIKWRPKPKNCEIRVYESLQGSHKFLFNISKQQ